MLLGLLADINLLTQQIMEESEKTLNRSGIGTREETTDTVVGRVEHDEAQAALQSEIGRLNERLRENERLMNLDDIRKRKAEERARELDRIQEEDERTFHIQSEIIELAGKFEQAASEVELSETVINALLDCTQALKRILKTVRLDETWLCTNPRGANRDWGRPRRYERIVTRRETGGV